MNANSKVKYLTCPSGIKGVVEVFGDPQETVRYTFWGGDFNKLTPEDRMYVSKTVQEISDGR